MRTVLARQIALAFVNRRRFWTNDVQRVCLERIGMRRLVPGERWRAFLNEMRDAFLEIR